MEIVCGGPRFYKPNNFRTEEVDEAIHVHTTNSHVTCGYLFMATILTIIVDDTYLEVDCRKSVASYVCSWGLWIWKAALVVIVVKVEAS